jgi:cobalt/nickel transport system ATP-binding protein
MKELLELQNVVFSYPGEKKVLQGINLSVKPGEKIAIIGKNGSGKTTLFNVIMGLLKPTEGKILFMGKDIEDKQSLTFLRRKVGFLFQDPENQLFCPTLLEDVAFGPLNMGLSPTKAKEVALETLELVGLTSLASAPPYSLSEGQKKMGALASILAMDPDLLLLDEPTSGLDETSQSKLEKILSESEKAMLIASHDMSFLAEHASKSFALSNGTLTPYDLGARTDA